MSSWVQNGSTVRVDCYFIFEKDRLFSKTSDKKTGRKSGDIKRLDVDNRLKPCLDQLSEMLQIDDKYFFAGWREKLWTLSKKEAARLTLTAHLPRQDLALNLDQDPVST